MWILRTKSNSLNCRLCFHDHTRIAKTVWIQGGPCGSHALCSRICTEHVQGSPPCHREFSSACADTILLKCSEVVCVISPHVEGNLSVARNKLPFYHHLPQTVFGTQWHSVLAYLLMDIPKHCILSSKRFSNLSSTYFPMDSYCLDMWVNLYWLLFNADS